MTPFFRMLFAFIPALALAIPSAEDRVFSEGGQSVDNFLIRTVNRISESWSFSRIEFQLASSCAVEESREKVREEVRKQTDAAMEHVREKAVDMIRNPPASVWNDGAKSSESKEDKN